MLSNVFDTECSPLLFVGLDPKLCLASSGFYPIVPQDRFAYILVLMTTQSQTNWPKESVSASLTKLLSLLEQRVDFIGSTGRTG